MKKERKYFIFNKETDYKRGYLEHMNCSKEGIWVAEHTYQKAAFLSRILDSQEQEMEWHRLELEESSRMSSPIKVSVYAANTKIVEWNHVETTIEEIIQSHDIALEDKIKTMEPYLQKTAIGMSDLLLHEVKGRYLWIMIEMYRQAGETVLVHNIKISFPRQSWITYLPEVYQESDYKTTFLERYLGIFQTLYEDLNDKIKEVSLSFDTELAESDFLNWLAQWIDISESYIWSEQQLRVLLTNGVDLYKRRGTRQGIIDFVSLYTGEKPYLVEAFQLSSYVKNVSHYGHLVSLYHNNPYSFCILVREEVIHSDREYKTLTKIIQDVKPAYMELKLITIKPYIFMNGYSYLGINSVLGEYRPMLLDGHALLPFSKVGSVVP